MRDDRLVARAQTSQERKLAVEVRHNNLAAPWWLGARGSAQNCLIEGIDTFVRALPPPWGAAGRGAGSLREKCVGDKKDFG